MVYPNHLLIFLLHPQNRRQGFRSPSVIEKTGKYMPNNPNPWNNDFFAKSWQSPFRRWWRYGRRLLLVFMLGVFLWVSLDLIAITINAPENTPSVMKVLLHATLTVSISLGLTGITQQLYLRFNSRFKPLKAFFQSRGKLPPL